MVKARPFFQSIYRQEGLLNEAGWAYDLDLADTKSLLAGIRKHYPLFILDFDYDEPKSLYLGRVHRLAKAHLLFNGMDVDGKWYDDNPRRVEYSEISGVRFGTRYAKMFLKYSPEM